jgi:hypothetical protein
MARKKSSSEKSSDPLITILKFLTSLLKAATSVIMIPVMVAGAAVLGLSYCGVLGFEMIQDKIIKPTFGENVVEGSTIDKLKNKIKSFAQTLFEIGTYGFVQGAEFVETGLAYAADIDEEEIEDKTKKLADLGNPVKKFEPKKENPAEERDPKNAKLPLTSIQPKNPPQALAPNQKSNGISVGS